MADADHVFTVPISGRQDDGLVEKVVDGVQQLVFLFDDVANFLKFLYQKTKQCLSITANYSQCIIKGQ